MKLYNYQMNPKTLSPQQRIIMQHLVDGVTVKEIAMLMELSSVTVRKHINKAKRKLGARTHDQAVAMVVARGDMTVSPQQKIIMQHLVDGVTVKEIAMLMELPSVKVRKHINKIKRKLGARTHDQAIAMVVARGDVTMCAESADPDVAERLTAK